MQNSKTVQFWDEYYLSLSSIDHGGVRHGKVDDSTKTKNNDANAGTIEATIEQAINTVDCDCNDQDSRRYEATAGDKEWIVQPSASLFQLLERYFRDNDCDFESTSNNEGLRQSNKWKLLEIGCGASTLAREFFIFLNRKSTSASSSFSNEVTATDVSQVCIEHMSRRDKELIRSSNGSFSYVVLDILSESEVSAITTNQGLFDIIFDKGCLDTFLFRSEHSLRPILAQKCLDNIHRLLLPYGKNIIVSPRKTIKYVTDYNGFASVERINLADESGILAADLDGRQAEINKGVPTGTSVIKPTKAFLFICTKNESYIPGKDIPFRQKYQEVDSTPCSRCGMTFNDFLSSNGAHDTKMINNRGSKYYNAWLRKWRGHLEHCKGGST